MLRDDSNFLEATVATDRWLAALAIGILLVGLCSLWAWASWSSASAMRVESAAAHEELDRARQSAERAAVEIPVPAGSDDAAAAVAGLDELARVAAGSVAVTSVRLDLRKMAFEVVGVSASLDEAMEFDKHLTEATGLEAGRLVSSERSEDRGVVVYRVQAKGRLKGGSR